MFQIITIRQLRAECSTLFEDLGKYGYIVTKRGLGKAIILPYFDGCDEFLDVYLNDYRIFKNRGELEEEFKDSFRSGPSDLII